MSRPGFLQHIQPTVFFTSAFLIAAFVLFVLVMMFSLVRALSADMRAGGPEAVPSHEELRGLEPTGD